MKEQTNGSRVNRRLLFMVLLLLALLWFSTRDREKSGGHPKQPMQGGKEVGGLQGDRQQRDQTIRIVAIQPKPADVRSVLRVDVEADPPSFEASAYRYRWLVNKQDVSHEATLPLKRFQQGDIVSVEVTLLQADGVASSPPVIDSVKIGNNPPVIKLIRLIPIPVSAGEAVRAEVTSEDIEGDFVHLTYEWQVNRQPIPANDRESLDGTLVHSADQIVLFVTPSDPFSKGMQQVSPLITVLNRSPEIDSLPPRQDEKGRYRYQVVARDPDGDLLHYTLIEGPPGMKIDSASGLIDWEVIRLSDEQSHVRMKVSDEKGGEVTQEFRVQTTSH